MNATATLIRSEAKMILRDPSDIVITLGMPVLMLVMWGFITNDLDPMPGGFAVFDVVGLPVAFTMTLALVAIMNVPIRITTYRKNGILRRLAVTPISPLRTLGAQVAVSAVQATVGIGIAYILGVIAFDSQAPENPLLTILMLVLTALALYSIGMVIASLAPSPNAAVAIGFILFFALGGLGGMFDGGQSLPQALVNVGNWLPFGAAVEALGATWTGGDIPARSIISLGASTVVGITVSAMTFRWNR